MDRTRRRDERSPAVGPKTIIIVVLAAFAGIITLALSSSIIEQNKDGYVKILQRLGGKMVVHSDPGYFIQWFGDIYEYKKNGTFTFDSTPEADLDESSAVASSINVRFQDGGTATVAGVVRFELPADEQNLLKLHQVYRSYAGVLANLVKPNVKEAVILSANLVTAEDSYSGGRSGIADTALDQLQKGVFLTESERQVVDDPATGGKKSIKLVKIKTDKDNNELRKDSPFLQIGIEIQSVTFPEDFGYEPGILAQISKVRETRMEAASAFARAQTAAQNAKTAVAEGKAAVAKAKAEEDVKKQRAVTQAEQKFEVAVLAATSRLRVEETNRNSAKFTKEEQILLGEGEATRKKLVMGADGALAQKLAAWENAQKYWSEAYSKRNVPQYVFGADSGGDGNASQFMQMMTMKLAKDLNLDTSTR